MITTGWVSHINARFIINGTIKLEVGNQQQTKFYLSHNKCQSVQGACTNSWLLWCVERINGAWCPDLDFMFSMHETKKNNNRDKYDLITLQSEKGYGTKAF